ncbi:MAG: hypothetical protein ACN4G0_01330 [Polyangiales bacterium]
MAPSRRLFVIAAFSLALAWGRSARAEHDEAASAQPEGTLPPVLVMLIGGGARFRSIHLEVGDAGGGTQPRSFETGAYFDFGWHLLVRPMIRRSPRASVQAIAFQIDGGSGIGLRVAPAGTGIELETNAWRLLGQFGYLYPIDRLQVGGLVGVGGDVLSIDLNSVLPSSRIIYVRVGPAVAYQILPWFLGIRADFGVRAPFYFGGLTNAFGSDTSGVGLDGTITFEGRVKAGFTYAARFVWEYYRLRFAGSNQNVPAMGAGGNGKDHALSIQVLLGWSL